MNDHDLNMGNENEAVVVMMISFYNVCALCILIPTMQHMQTYNTRIIDRHAHMKVVVAWVGSLSQST